MRDVEDRLRLAKRPPDCIRAQLEEQSGGDVESAHGQVDADEEDRDLHGAEEVLDVVVHAHQRGVPEPQLVVERAQLLVRRLELLLGRLQLLVRAAQLLVARLRFLRRGGGLVGQLLAIVDGRLQRMPQTVNLRSPAGRHRPPLRRRGDAVEHDPAAVRIRRRGAVRDHFERNTAANVAIHHEDVFLGHGDPFPERAADSGPQHRQDLAIPDQAEEIQSSVPRFQRNERSNLPANAQDVHLFIDEHRAWSEMGGQEGVVLVAGGASGGPRRRRGRRRGQARPRRARGDVERGRRVRYLVFAVNQRLHRDRRELFRRPAEILRASEHQKSARCERVLKDCQRFLL